MVAAMQTIEAGLSMRMACEHGEFWGVYVNEFT